MCDFVSSNTARTAMQTIKCKSCLLGKQTELATPSRSKPRTEGIGARLYVDIRGSVGQPTLAGSEYIVVIKDEATNYRLVNMIRSRESAYDCLRGAIAFFESRGHKIRTLISDNGSEFTSKRTTELLAAKSIMPERSAPSAQNGFIERENRTIVKALYRPVDGKSGSRYHPQIAKIELFLSYGPVSLAACSAIDLE